MGTGVDTECAAAMVIAADTVEFMAIRATVPGIAVEQRPTRLTVGDTAADLPAAAMQWVDLAAATWPAAADSMAVAADSTAVVGADLTVAAVTDKSL
jgi:hypothetical protein